MNLPLPLTMTVNIHKSNSFSVWPIQCAVTNIIRVANRPFVGKDFKISPAHPSLVAEASGTL